MMFYSSIGAMSRNRSIVESFAHKMGWGFNQAEATLDAYATGMFLPTKDEVTAISEMSAFVTEWRLAVYAFNILQLQQSGVDLSQVASPDTQAKWVRGTSAISTAKRQDIQRLFGVDVSAVPESRRFVYAEAQPVVARIDTRRMHLKIGISTYFLAQVSPDTFVVRFDNTQDLKWFHENVTESGLVTVDSGDFKRVTIPDSASRVYYDKI